MSNSKRAIVATITCILMLAQLLIPIGEATVSATTLEEGISIRFLPLNVTAPDDVFADFGEIFGARNGLQYGWNINHNSIGVTDSVYRQSDSIPFLEHGYWEMELPDGQYNVDISVGDAVYGTTNTIYVEDHLLFDHIPLNLGQESTLSDLIQVSDGRLTIRSDDGVDHTAIRNVTITAVPASVSAFRQLNPPTISLPTEISKVSGDKVLLSGRQNNAHNAIPFIKLGGLEQTIGSYMSGEITAMENRLAAYQQQAANVNSSSLTQAITNSMEEVVKVKTGHLNLDASVTYGSPTKPVYVFVDGINTNNNLTITVYGTLVINGNLNANQSLSIKVIPPSGATGNHGGNLWVKGTLHLNNNSQVEVADEMLVGSLTYNNGQLSVQAGRLIVSDSMHINTSVQMTVREELLVGSVVSNNQVANINVLEGDFYIRGDIHVNNHLEIQTGGVFAVGGNMVSNQKPIIKTGVSTTGSTKLKYTLLGVKAEYYAEANLSGQKLTLIEDTIELNGSVPVPTPALQDGVYSVRWSGTIEPSFSESFTFGMKVKGGVRLWVDDQLLIDEWAISNEEKNYEASIPLAAGGDYNLRVEYTSNNNSSKAILSWGSNSQAKQTVPANRLAPFATTSVVAVPSANDIVLGWVPVMNADGYELELDGRVELLGVQNQYIHSSLESGVHHQYRIRPISGDIKGDWSSIEEKWTLSGIPQNITQQVTSTSIQLTWDDVVGAVSYELESNNQVFDIGSSPSYLEINLNPNIQRTYKIRAKNSSGSGAWSPLIVVMTDVSIPRNLRSVPDDRSIQLQWDSASGAASYDIEVDGAILSGITDMNYIHNELDPSTIHTYRVRTNSVNGASPWSQPYTVQTLPSIPEDVVADALEQSITINWSATEGAANYDIEVDGLITHSDDNTSYLHDGLTPSTEHQYRVRGVNGSIVGKWSNYVSKITSLSVPDHVQAIVINSKEIRLQWDMVLGASSYEVSVDGAVTNVGSSTTYVHGNLEPFSMHSYQVRGIGVGGPGGWSEIIVETSGLGQPQNVIATPNTTSILISWDSVEGADTYEVMIDGTIINNGALRTYEHVGLFPNSVYVYRVRAVNEFGAGDWSEALLQSTKLGTPQFDQITTSSDNIHLTWNEVSGAIAYELEMDGHISDIGADTYYTHTELIPNTSHTYRVRAKNSSDWSDWSNPITGSTTPDMPRNVTTEVTTTSILLAWDISLGASSYELEFDGEIHSNILDAHLDIESLVPNTMHTYRIRAVGAGGNSPWTTLLMERTTPELSLNVSKDILFNFVMVLPKQGQAVERYITVNYNPDDLEVIDLFAVTPEVEMGIGNIANTLFTIVEVTDGQITYKVAATQSAAVNSIRLQAKTNNYSKISYTIK